MAVLIKTLKLSFDGKQVSCQLDNAELVDEPTTEDVTTFCGTETSSDPRYKLNIGGFQDYGAAEAVCDMLHDAYRAKVDTPLDPGAGKIAFVLEVGGKTRSGDASPIQDVPFGGAAGSPLKFSTVLDATNVVDGVAAKAGTEPAAEAPVEAPVEVSA